jgi:prolyl oligopeptidase
MTDDDVLDARRGDTVEELHGVTIDDPYRWMEDLDSPELRRWVDAVADEADEELARLPGRDAFSAALEAALDVPRGRAPWRRGGWWFQLRNSGLQDHDVLWFAEDDDPDGPGVAPTDGWCVLLDPNGWDGARSLGPVAPSPDGTLLAYAVSEAGSDWQTWHVLEITTGAERDDRVPWSKFSGATWLPDGSGILTCTYEAPAAGEEHEAAVRDQRVVLHRLGGDTEVVYALPDEPEAGFSPSVTHDDRWLVVTVTRGTDPETRLHVLPIDDDGTLGEPVRLVDDATAMWWPLDGVGDELWCLTDDDAPLRRVVALSLPDGARREVLAESDDQLEDVAIAGADTPDEDGWLITSHLHHAASLVRIHGLDGVALHEVPLGPLSSVGEQIGGQLSTSRRHRTVHLIATSFNAPTRLLRHDPATTTTTLLTHEAVPTSATATRDDLVVERVFVRSGAVEVPVFLVRRADVEPTGEVPTVLWGYGGFSIAVTPHFRPAWTAWVAHGGLLAVACLRGGSEYGRAWADDGRLDAKQHVFDDALAVAAWLCGEGEAHDDDGAPLDCTWTSSEHLGIEGRSNGGLLAAACLTQAPERFASVVPEVGVLDLLRFHMFTIGWAWTSDYGDPDTPEGLSWVLAYSPLHRIEDGTAYPATLITTGDTDDRVVPSHSFKFAAALRHAQAGDEPVLLRVDRAAGHGVGKPTSQVIRERADVLAWHAWHLGLDVV